MWASLRADGELSELEGALLDAHLSGCAACREVAAGFAVVTESLRAAPLVQPSPVALHVRRAPSPSSPRPWTRRTSSAAFAGPRS